MASAQIVGILLSAGRGERFGGAKLLAPLKGGDVQSLSIGVAACQRIVAALPHTVAVVRPGDGELAASLQEERAHVIVCANADDGMGASLACGIAAARDADGWIIALADMPWIEAGTIRAVADAIRNGASLAAPTYRGERGHPVGFSARFRDELLALTGDEGAKSILAAHRSELTLIEVADPGILRDIDTPTDLATDN